MKKTYNVVLDIEPTENVNKWLSSRSLSFSGWVNALVNEVNNELESKENSWMRKPAAELTLQEFGEGLSYWLRKIKDVEQE